MRSHSNDRSVGRLRKGISDLISSALDGKVYDLPVTIPGNISVAQGNFRAAVESFWSTATGLGSF